MEFMLEEFEPIASQYPVLLFDSYGVIKSSKGLVPGIERTFEWLKAEKKEY